MITERIIEDGIDLVAPLLMLGTIFWTVLYLIEPPTDSMFFIISGIAVVIFAEAIWISTPVSIDKSIWFLDTLCKKFMALAISYIVLPMFLILMEGFYSFAKLLFDYPLQTANVAAIIIVIADAVFAWVGVNYLMKKGDQKEV